MSNTVDHIEDTVGAGDIGDAASVTKTVTQTSHGFVAGDVVRVDASYNLIKALADTGENAEAIGIVGIVTDTNNFELITSGQLNLPSHGFSEGPLFLSDSVAGGLTDTAPTGIVKPVAQVLDANNIIVIDMRGSSGSGGGGGGGSSDFLGLTDTPSSYTGQAGKIAKVNPGETGLIFEDETGGGAGGGSTTIPYAEYSDTTTEVLLANDTPIKFTGIVTDSDNVYNSSTGEYTAPQDGTLLISAYLIYSSSFTGGVVLYKNNSSLYQITDGGVSSNQDVISKEIEVTSGDVITLKVNSGITLATGGHASFKLLPRTISGGGGSANGENWLINGSTAIDQRGDGPYALTSSQLYTVDRWFAWQNDSAGTATPTVATGLDGFASAIRLQRNNAATSTNSILLAQVLESVNSIPFQGKEVTLSMYIKAGAGYTGGAGFTTALQGGTGVDESSSAFAAGTWTGFTSVGSGTHTPTTSWQRVTVTATVGSSITQLGVNINWAGTGTAGADDYVDITGIKLEIGSSASDFHNARNELELCKRYFQYGALALSCEPGEFSYGVAGQRETLSPQMRVGSTTLSDYSTLAGPLAAMGAGQTYASNGNGSVSTLVLGGPTVGNFQASGSSTGREINFETTSAVKGFPNESVRVGWGWIADGEL
jgi:hypothetical protein